MDGLTFDELGLCVVEVREQIAAADPGAYSGFVTDSACYKVARLAGVKATDALRAYRRLVPARKAADPIAAVGSFRGFPKGARKPQAEAVEAAAVPCALSARP